MRLTRARRWRAGWLLALAYLVCVLAPTISFAMPGSHAASPCLIDASHGAGMALVQAEAPVQHVHMDGPMHGHSSANAGDGGHSVAMALNGSSVPEKAPHVSDGQCCGLTCVTALPAVLVDIAKPSAPPTLCVVEFYRKVTDNAPSRLYRPPIS